MTDGLPYPVQALGVICTSGDIWPDRKPGFANPVGSPGDTNDFKSIASEIGADCVVATHRSAYTGEKPWFGVACRKSDSAASSLTSDKKFVIQIDNFVLENKQVKTRDGMYINRVYEVVLVELAKKGYWAYLAGDAQTSKKKVDYSGPLEGIKPDFKLVVSILGKESSNYIVGATTRLEVKVDIVDIGTGQTVESIQSSGKGGDSTVVDVLIDERKFRALEKAVQDCIRKMHSPA